MGRPPWPGQMPKAAISFSTRFPPRQASEFWLNLSHLIDLITRPRFGGFFTFGSPLTSHPRLYKMHFPLDIRSNRGSQKENSWGGAESSAIKTGLEF